MTDEHQDADASGDAQINREPGAADPPAAGATEGPHPEEVAAPEPAAATAGPGDGASPEPEAADAAPGPEAAAPPPAEPPGPGPARRSLPPAVGYLGAAVLGIVIGAGGLAIASGGIGPSATPTPAPTPSTEPSSPPVGNVVGDPSAPVTIEVWADYQCSFCRLEDLLFGGAIEREYVMSGLVRVVYRDFAFLGRESSDAAVATRCAGRQDPAAQLRFHDALYTFQQGVDEGRFVRENLVQIAGIAGVPDADAFVACLDDPAVVGEVEAETLEGRGLGIDSTPTMRLRGPGGERVLRGFSQTWPTLRDAIEDVLVAAPSPDPSATPGTSPSAEPSASPSAAPSPSPSPTG